jgi:dehydrogenase/reductase SDR family protein 4
MLRGKTCLIIGGTHGIGYAIARKFVAEEAALVIVCSRKQSSVDKALKTLSEASAEEAARTRTIVTGTICNVSNRKDIDDLIIFVRNELQGKQLDVLVSNVGVDPVSGKALDATESVFEKIFSTNVKAAWLLIKLLKPFMQHGSAILLVASTGGLQPAVPGGLYGTSKAALIALGRALATELGPEGIRINTICPGLVKTRMSEAFWKGPYGKEAENALFLRRLGEPEDVADVASFLVSSSSRWLTGEAIVVSGGTHTRL